MTFPTAPAPVSSEALYDAARGALYRANAAMAEALAARGNFGLPCYATDLRVCATFAEEAFDVLRAYHDACRRERVDARPVSL